MEIIKPFFPPNFKKCFDFHQNVCLHFLRTHRILNSVPHLLLFEKYHFSLDFVDVLWWLGASSDLSSELQGILILFTAMYLESTYLTLAVQFWIQSQNTDFERFISFSFFIYNYLRYFMHADIDHNLIVFFKKPFFPNIQFSNIYTKWMCKWEQAITKATERQRENPLNHLKMLMFS